MMTKQESFKKRIRARMATTGERYGAARRSLIAAASGADRDWASHPEVSDDAVRSATGRSWNEWCDLIDAWPGRDDGHTAIAAYLLKNFDVDGWWAQSVTGGYERITGRRLPNQHPDGTFTANKSKTVTADGDRLRAMLLSDDERSDLFPGVYTELKSRPTTKALRIAIGGGTAVFGFDPSTDGRLKVTIQHRGLSSVEAVGEWKFYWSDWLDAIDDGD